MTGQFPTRYAKRIGTGVHVKLEPGFSLCIQLSPELSEKGMVAANAPGYFKDGEIYVDLVNAGKEIVNVKQGTPLCRILIQKMFLEGEESPSPSKVKAKKSTIKKAKK